MLLLFVVLAVVAYSFRNNYVLQGYGLGLNWIGPYGVSLKASWAQRTGQLSQAVQTYLTQNGGTSLNRFWITGSIQF